MVIPVWVMLAIMLIMICLLWALISMLRVHFGLVAQLAENNKMTEAAVRSEKSTRRILEALQKRGIEIPKGYTIPYDKPIDIDALVKHVYDISKAHGVVGHGENAYYFVVDLHGPKQQFRSQALEDGRIIVWLDKEQNKKAPNHIIQFAKEVENRMKQEAEYAGARQ